MAEPHKPQVVPEPEKRSVWSAFEELGRALRQAAAQAQKAAVAETPGARVKPALVP